MQDIEARAWFCKLSLVLRRDILARARVRRLANVEALAPRGTPAGS